VGIRLAQFAATFSLFTASVIHLLAVARLLNGTIAMVVPVDDIFR
jgi:hypothetical protein